MPYEQDFYHECANILNKASTGKDNVKNLVYKSIIKDKRKLMALVCNYMKIHDKIDNIYTMYFKGIQLSPFLVKIFIYEYYFGFKKSHLLKKELITYKLFKQFYMMRKKIINSEDFFEEKLSMKYFRVNTLKTNEKMAIMGLTDNSFVLSPLTDNIDFDSKKIYKDPHIKQLYSISPFLDIHENPFVINGSLIIQDKNKFLCYKYTRHTPFLKEFSCIPAIVLNAKPDSHVIDTCAAPGNKTSQLAALMQNKGKIFAVEQDPKRMKLLRKRLEHFGVSNTTFLESDFTQIDPMVDRFSHVEYILVDPSCTGSGILNRPKSFHYSDDYTHLSEDQECRLQKLSTFQCRILEHALSFPAVKRVVYSTCSILPHENEWVIRNVYKKVKNDFYLASVMPTQFPTQRGQVYESIKIPKNIEKRERLYRKCLRTVPYLSNNQCNLNTTMISSTDSNTDINNLDKTLNPNDNYNNMIEILDNGFFVALFKRRKRTLNK